MSAKLKTEIDVLRAKGVIERSDQYGDGVYVVTLEGERSLEALRDELGERTTADESDRDEYDAVVYRNDEEEGDRNVGLTRTR